jgi:steroid 5-alpha reductase family enzyme
LQTLVPAKALGPLGYAAGAAFLVGFAWETIADLQKFWFKSKHPDKCAANCPTLTSLSRMPCMMPDRGLVRLSLLPRKGAAEQGCRAVLLYSHMAPHGW